MKAYKTERNFRGFLHEKYTSDIGEEGRLLHESSMIGDYPDSFKYPGSSYLFIGEDYHLSREEVAEMIDIMAHWLQNKRLPNNNKIKNVT